jgi:hypothetical protein
MTNFKLGKGLEGGGEMKLFRHDNTEGYTDEQLDKLNTEWEHRALELGLDEFDDPDEYDLQSKWFADEVARR